MTAEDKAIAHALAFVGAYAVVVVVGITALVCDWIDNRKKEPRHDR